MNLDQIKKDRDNGVILGPVTIDWLIENASEQDKQIAADAQALADMQIAMMEQTELADKLRQKNELLEADLRIAQTALDAQGNLTEVYRDIAWGGTATQPAIEAPQALSDLAELTIYKFAHVGQYRTQEFFTADDVRKLLAAAPAVQVQLLLNLHQAVVEHRAMFEKTSDEFNMSSSSIVAALDALAALPAPVAEEAAQPLNGLTFSRGYEQARIDIAKAAQAQPVAMPEFSRDPDGDLCIDWRVGDKTISISFNTSGLVTWATDGASGFEKVDIAQPVADAMQGEPEIMHGFYAKGRAAGIEEAATYCQQLIESGIGPNFLVDMDSYWSGLESAVSYIRVLNANPAEGKQ